MKKYALRRIKATVAYALNKLLAKAGVTMPSKRTKRIIDGRSRELSKEIAREIRKHRRRTSKEKKRLVLKKALIWEGKH